MKFNESASVVVSAGYDRSMRVWDCRSQNTEPIQVFSPVKWISNIMIGSYQLYMSTSTSASVL